MEFPRGLIVVLAVLGLGFCADAYGVFEGGAAWWIFLLLLLGRIAAILGILMRTRLGWYLAVAFFVVIIALGLLAGGRGFGLGLLIRTFIPAGCLIYLLAAREEFN